MKRRFFSFVKSAAAESKFIGALGVKKLIGAVVIGGWHKNLRGSVQVAVVRRGDVHEILRGGEAVFFQHQHEQLGVDEGPGVKEFHSGREICFKAFIGADDNRNRLFFHSNHKNQAGLRQLLHKYGGGQSF